MLHWTMFRLERIREPHMSTTSSTISTQQVDQNSSVKWKTKVPPFIPFSFEGFTLLILSSELHNEMFLLIKNEKWSMSALRVMSIRSATSKMSCLIEGYASMQKHHLSRCGVVQCVVIYKPSNYCFFLRCSWGIVC